MTKLLTRRKFIETACWSGVAASVMPTVSFARAPTDNRLVFVLLRGAMDGMHAVVPVGDPSYRATRGSLAYKASDLTMIDDTFGLAPGLSPLVPDLKRGELLAIQGVAIPYRTRSHFDAQSILETGMNRPVGSATGWINRTLGALGGQTGLGIAVGGGLPKSLQGDVSVSTWSPGGRQAETESFDDILAQLYENDRDLNDPYMAAQMLQDQAMGMNTRRKKGAGRMNQLFSTTAKFLSDPEGPRIAAVELSGWDTHANQGLKGGVLDRNLAALAQGLQTLKSGFSKHDWKKTVVVVATEFGRTAAANGNNGTDHGTAGATLLYGGAVRGGKVMADWPGLAKAKLYEGRDLRPTLDTRQILKGVLAHHYDLTPRVLNSEVFPDSGAFAAVPNLIRS